MGNVHGIKIFIFLFISFFISKPAFAESFNLPDPGLTPESPLYFLDLWDEQARLFFTRSDSGRFHKIESNLQERLAETEALAGRGISANQKSLGLYVSGLPFFYAAAERFGDTLILAGALRVATDHLDILDTISERTDFEKKRFIPATKKFIIDQQLQTLQVFAKRDPLEALRIFTDALQRRMARIREVAIDDENNEEALDEYAAYMSEADMILRKWDIGEDTDGLTIEVYLSRAVRGHEETLLGPVRDRLPPMLEGELLFAVNSVRKLSGKELLRTLPPRADAATPITAPQAAQQTTPQSPADRSNDTEIEMKPETKIEPEKSEEGAVTLPPPTPPPGLF